MIDQAHFNCRPELQLKLELKRQKHPQFIQLQTML